MPSVDWNKKIWDDEYNWELKGEEWSKAWGGSEAQWFSSIYPRVHRFLECDSVLEIACGFGRWTKYLKSFCRNLTGIDLSQECIDYCTKYMKDESARFVKNDGLSLRKVAKSKYDFVFSFDSLVHVNPSVLESYIKQILPILNKNGVCFLHHSNFGAVKQNFEEGNFIYRHNRDQTTTAKKVKEIVEAQGGKILIQEVIDWGGGDAIDCLTTFSKAKDFARHEETQIVNNQFMVEAGIIHDVHARYTEV